MDNSLLAVRDINHKYIVVERSLFMEKNFNHNVDIFLEKLKEDSEEYKNLNTTKYSLTEKKISFVLL